MATKTADRYGYLLHLLRPAAAKFSAAAKRPFVRRAKAQAILPATKTFVEMVAAAQPTRPKLDPSERAKAVRIERDRCKTIVRYGLEKGQMNQASHLAFQSDFDVEDAIRIMDVTAQIKANGPDTARRR
ncbi:hypothetical protein [Paraburkholderia lacunae]|uniref:Uncharacterized protein n=1 Tax=Paraburkholderia lacunae TaxID=2211104 RepID=A0A370N7N4_9BURK|nr:hypothetical protein [Paraburkholderia lacunae]RDK01619.1 hypothetical protein DLM46_17615 [Paraburkholderia lacunae]